MPPKQEKGGTKAHQTAALVSFTLVNRKIQIHHQTMDADGKQTNADQYCHAARQCGLQKLHPYHSYAHGGAGSEQKKP